MRPRSAVGRAVTQAATACLMLIGLGAELAAQSPTVRRAGQEPIRRDQPVYYLADNAQYDREAAFVTLTGHVEIWQGDRVLRADRVTYDRKTGVAAATGHVVLLEPDGEVLFSDYAELTGSMKDGVLKNVSAQLAENGKLVANSGRRTDAKLNELSRAVYSTCDLCKTDPNRAPLWQLRARTAVQDLDNKRIEYQDVVLDIYGVPVFWLPYLTHPDPSAKRASGFLVPSGGSTSHLGAFFTLPYYWAIDQRQDAIITPMITTKNYPQIDTQYRIRFNSGQIKANVSAGYDNGKPQGSIFADGQFAINDEWLWGFNINAASSTNYVRDYKLTTSTDLLASAVYAEAYGQGAYSRLDSLFYQGLSSDVVASQLPYVLPHYQYDFTGQPDALGGRTSLQADAFNVLRDVGTNTERGALRMNWERPYTGPLGDVWKFTLHGEGAVYSTRQLDAQPTWGPGNTATSAQGLPTAAIEARWPFARDGGASGRQLIEPIVQLVAAPYASSYPIAVRPNGTRFVNSLIPNEDSLGVEFTDANLFSLSRFSGFDRLEGGPRAAVALHGAWYLPGGQSMDAQIGQSYRLHDASAFPTGSGLEKTVSDVVGHVTISPSSYFDVTTRARFDPHTWQTRFVDTLASAGPSWLRFSAGYLYTPYNPFNYYSVAPTGTFDGTGVRNEGTVGVNTSLGRYRLGGYATRDLATGSMVAAGASASYENECAIFTGSFYRRYTSLGGDNGATTVLFQITLKTVGTFGYHAF